MFLQYRWSPNVTVDFILKTDVHRYNTGYANQIHVQNSRTALTANSFLNFWPQVSGVTENSSDRSIKQRHLEIVT